MESLELRPYRPTDVAAIVAIVNFNILNSTALYDYEPRTEQAQQAVFEEKLQKGFPIWVATIGDELVGFGYYSEFRFREAYQYTVEHSVYVAPDFYGKGIGKELLQQLIQLAKAQGKHTLIAVIDSENQGSIKFHEQFGFTTVGVLKQTGFKFDRWLDTVLLQLIL